MRGREVAELLAFVFCAAVGFAMAGTVTSLYQLVTAQPAEFLTARSSVAGNVVAVLLTMFGGPAIVTRLIVAGLRDGRVTLVPAALGLAVAAMWSVLAGVFFLGLLITA